MTEVSDSNTRKCPFCAEIILADAIKCKHCQSDLTDGGAGQNSGDNKPSGGGVLGVTMLIVPIVTTLLIWFWVGSMSLLQDPGMTMMVLGVLTILVTAILAAVEAQQMGAGQDSDVDKKGNKRSGAGGWFAFVLLLWIVGFPAWLYRRSNYGLTNLVAGGVVVALIFGGSWSAMTTAIETKKAEIRGRLSGIPGPQDVLTDGRDEARAAALEEQERMRKEFEEQMKTLQSALERAQNEEKEMRAKLAEAEASGNVEAIAKAKAELVAAKENTRQARSRHSSARGGGSKDNDKSNSSGGDLSDDPLGGLEL